VSDTALDQLRAEAVAARGLDPAAVSFVTGATVEQIEASADDLARVIGQREDAQHEQPAGSDVFSRAAEDKQRRREAFLSALVGRPQPQPRDEQGRFASGGFDGGSRTPPPSPPESHEDWLLRLLRTHPADRPGLFQPSP
jgi:hypothetical protein